MHFDLNDLRLFVRTGEESNLTRAARLQHLSLAAASARIKALEGQVGMPLLVREARGVSLSPPGQAFMHHARSMLRQVDRLRVDMQEYGGGLRGHLRIYANTTAVTDFLPEVLPGFLAQHPRVNVDLQEKPNADIARGVQEGRCDLGIVSGRVDTLGLQAIHFSTDRLVLVTSRKHPFSRRKSIAFADSLDEDQVGMHQGSTLQNFLEEETEKLGKTQKLRIQLSSFDAMCRMIGSGVCIGVVPESAAQRYRHSMGLALIRLTDDWCIRKRYVLMCDQAALPAYATDMVNALFAYHQKP